MPPLGDTHTVFNSARWASIEESHKIQMGKYETLNTVSIEESHKIQMGKYETLNTVSINKISQLQMRQIQRSKC